MSSYDAIVLGGGAPGEHCAAALAAPRAVGGQLSSGSSSVANVPTGPAFPRSRCCVRARRCAAHWMPAQPRRSMSRRRSPGATSWCRTTPTPGRSGGWPANGVDLLRGTGRLAGAGVVDVDGERHTAEHVVVATGSDPVTGTRSGACATYRASGAPARRPACSEIPRRLLVLGGGSAGVELAQVVRRLGGEAVLVEGADRILPREPAPLGHALGEALRRDGIELVLGLQHGVGAPRRSRSSCCNYHVALEHGDLDGVVSIFATDGYLREPVGTGQTHRGYAQLRSFFANCFSHGGGIDLAPCVVTDDSKRCAVEYTCRRWGAYPLPRRPGSRCSNAPRTIAWQRCASTTTSRHLDDRAGHRSRPGRHPGVGQRRPAAGRAVAGPDRAHRGLQGARSAGRAGCAG